MRDSLGSWICGFSVNIGIGNIAETELWSLLKGLQMAWDKGITSLDVECDSLSVVSLMAKVSDQSHPFFVYLKIASYC